VIGQVFVLLSSMLGLLDLRFRAGADAVRHGSGGGWSLFWFCRALGMFCSSSRLVVHVLPVGKRAEGHWGVFRYNLFVFVGCTLTAVVAFITPGAAATNAFMAGSVFSGLRVSLPRFRADDFFHPAVRSSGSRCHLGGYGVSLFSAVGPPACRFSPPWVTLTVLRPRHRVHRCAPARKMEGQARVLRGQRPSRSRATRCHVCGKTDVFASRSRFPLLLEMCGRPSATARHIQNHAQSRRR